jgi:uncharacterized Fe-S cluster protein YjdI
MMNDESGNRDYSNNEITIFWRPSKCVHATTCYRELIEVFNPRKRPWVNINGASVERIIEVIEKCPTDALTFQFKDPERQKQYKGSKNHHPDKPNKPTEEQPEEKDIPVNIKLMADGPIVVGGKFKVIGADGNDIKTMAMVSFCRCGGSFNMPFCDGTHRKIGFKTEIE